MINRFLKSDFIKSSFTVFAGTLIAQIIGFAVLPITSRLYSENAFGMLSLIVSIATVVSSVGTLKYEQSILLPRSSLQALLLTKVSLLLSLILGVLSLFFITLFSSQLTTLLGEPAVEPYLFIIPVLFFFNCFTTVNKNYGIRQKKFKLMSIIDVLKALIGGGGQIIFGLFKPITLGLLSGPILSSMSANFFLFKKLGVSSFKEIFNIKKEIRLIKLLLKRYKNFPLYNVPATIANNLVLHGQNIFIFGLFSAEDLGQLSMAQKLLAIPTVLIGSSIANVLLNKLKEDKLEINSLENSFKNSFLILLLCAIPFTVFGYLLLPTIIPFFLGKKWAFAGELAVILIFLYATRLVVTPLSGFIIILEKQKQYLFLILIQLFFIVLTFIFVTILNLKMIGFLKIYVALQILFYLIFLTYIYHISKANVK